MGNICRSPLAQGVFEDVLRREGLEDVVFVDSAGTGAWQQATLEEAQRETHRAGVVVADDVSLMEELRIVELIEDHAVRSTPAGREL